MATTTPVSVIYQFSRRSKPRRCGPLNELRTAERSTTGDQGASLEETPFPPIVSPDAKERLCLKCRRPFLSTWAGHRLCDPCRLENRDIAMPNGIAPPLRQREEVSLED